MRIGLTVDTASDYEIAGGAAPDVVVFGLASFARGFVPREAVVMACSQGSPVLVIAPHAEPYGVVEMIDAGARGVISRTADPNEVVTAVLALAEGGGYVTPSLATAVLGAALRFGRRSRVSLTDRDKELLILVAAGLTDKAIAARLSISMSGVRSRLDRLSVKSGRRGRPALTRLALELGLVIPDE